ncbi:MAG: PilZ domain-containing protein [Phycisphaerae bacterium]
MNRRKRYRVVPEKPGDVQISVRAQGGDPLEGEPVDLNLDGAGVCFLSLHFDQARHPPILAVGRQVELSFKFHDGINVVTAAATVTRRGDGSSSRHYGFRFCDHQQLESQLSARLYSFFNRRGAYRVEPARGTPVHVNLIVDPDGSQIQAQIIDVSVTGIGFYLPAEAELELATSDRIVVSIPLPDSPQPLNLPCIIRSRQLAGPDLVHYGVEFDLEHSRDRERQQDAILDYVLKFVQPVRRKAKDAGALVNQDS